MGSNLVKHLSPDNTIYGLDIVAPEKEGVARTFSWDDLESPDFPEIDAVIHPQSLINGMVEFCDGTILSVMNPPSMLFPIQHVLTYPDRYPPVSSKLDWLTQQTLEFLPIDEERFPSVQLAKKVLHEGGSMGCFFNGANEALVQRFLSGEIAWHQIVPKLQDLVDGHRVQSCLSLEDILQIDSEARALAREC